MRNRFEWNEEKENLVLKLRDEEGWTYKQIAEEIGYTTSSIKHKYIRLKQSQNDDNFHHPEEKTEHIITVLRDNMDILETHAGFGNMSKVYNQYANSHLLLEKKAERISYLEELKLTNTEIIKCDSEREIHRLVYERKKFDFIDIDPYGFPSRLFPHVFELVDDGYIVVTIPKAGVQKLNKLTVEHLRVFWSYEKGNDYLKAITTKIKDYGFKAKRSVEIESTLDLGRLYRILLKVKKTSSFDLVGLKVKGVNE